MNSLNTFTYFITSANRTTTSDECNDCTIDIGPIGENYDTYYCKCIAFNMNVDTLVVNGPSLYYLVADDLAEKGYNTNATDIATTRYNLSNRQCVLGWLSHHDGNGEMKGEGAHFIIKNLRQKRQIRFRLYDANLVPEDGTYTQATTQWSCVLLLTPIS